MPTPTKGPRLGGSPAHERHMLANLAIQLFTHRSITTTEAKARRVRPYAERLITLAKRGDIASRRRVIAAIGSPSSKVSGGTSPKKTVVHELFTEIAPAMAERQGGYTRITKIGYRKGDNAPLAVIELVLEPLSAKQATVAEAEAATKRSSKSTGAKKKTAAPAEAEPAATKTEDAVATEPQDAVDADTAPYGAGSHVPLDDPDAAPDGYAVKGNKDSMKFHTPASPWYSQTVAEVWFDSATSAEAAGFVEAGKANDA